MIRILKIRYDDERYWYSSHKRLKEILTDPHNQDEMFIVYLDKNGMMSFELLTNLKGTEVLINDEIIKIPD